MMEIEDNNVIELEYDSQEPHLLSEQVKWMVVHYKNLNWSNKKTAEEVGRLYNRPTLSHTTVKSIWEKISTKWDSPEP